MHQTKYKCLFPFYHVLIVRCIICGVRLGAYLNYCHYYVPESSTSLYSILMWKNIMRVYMPVSLFIPLHVYYLWKIIDENCEVCNYDRLLCRRICEFFEILCELFYIVEFNLKINFTHIKIRIFSSKID